MCTNPRQIKNPNLGCKSLKFVDTTSQFIYVPCGKCDECVRLRQLFFVQRVQMEALENHMFFASLTYNNDMIPTLGLSNGFFVRYVDTKDFINMLKRLRVHNSFGRPFRFVAVTELGSERGRPHMHCIFFLPKYDGDSLPVLLDLEQRLFTSVLSQWKRNVSGSCSRYTEFKPLCTFVRKMVRGKIRSTYDLHYVNPVLSDGSDADVAFYVSKYMIKKSEKLVNLQRALRLNLPDEEYADVWKLVKPKWFASPGFGLNSKFIRLNEYEPSPVVVDYIRGCVDFSRKYLDTPKFINPIDGSTFPLGRYYINNPNCYTVSDQEFFYKKSVANGSKRADNMIISDRDLSSILTSIDNSRLKMDSLEFDYDDFDELF